VGDHERCLVVSVRLSLTARSTPKMYTPRTPAICGRGLAVCSAAASGVTRLSALLDAPLSWSSGLGL